jgi:epoxyqueuosine reductase
MMTLTQLIKEKAYALGFDLIGVAPASRAPHAEAYRRWLAQGYQAGMAWLARRPERREAPDQVVAGAKSVVVVGLSYFVLDPPGELWADPSRGRLARYAWGIDYHEVMIPRLRQLGDFIDHLCGQTRRQRAYVDTGPVLERDFAAQAGLGFIGKNTLLISPRLGSYLFLGEILIDLELDYDQPAAAGGASCRDERPGRSKRLGSCGNCTRCLEICPTYAFPAPYILDSNRCISYLTIELKGSIPLQLRPLLGNWIFGCDACQEICPWVRRFSQPGRAGFLRYEPELIAPKLIDLMALDEAAFRARYRNSPIQRTKRRGFLRNVAVALGNWGDPQALPVLEQARYDPEPLIREHALWAIEQITKRRGQR